MYSLRYGALPIARATGGIHEIIEDYDPWSDTGYGFLYYDASAEAFWDAIKRAREIFHDSGDLDEISRPCDDAEFLVGKGGGTLRTNLCRARAQQRTRDARPAAENFCGAARASDPADAAKVGATAPRAD